MDKLGAAVTRALIHSVGAGLITFGAVYAREGSNMDSTVTMDKTGQPEHPNSGSPNIIVDTDATYSFSNYQCSLVEAVANANYGNQTYVDCAPGLPGADVIGFDPSLNGSRILLYETLTLFTPVTITGPGADLLEINGQDMRRHILNTSTSTLSGLTLEDGFSATSAGSVRNEGTMILDGVVIRDNVAQTFSGAIENLGNLTIRRSTIHNNTSTDGGAIVTIPGSSLIIEQSTISNNLTTGNGAAGIIALAPTAIFNSTISGNTGFSPVSPGGISSSSTLNIVHSTIYDNDEGGLAFFSGGTGTISYSIIANNNSYDCNNIDTSTSEFNLDSDGTCANMSANHITADPQLASLAFNGGATMTNLPMPGSPAIDAITTACELFVDQRLVFRPEDGDGDGSFRCDIGSVEVRPDALFSNGFE